MSERETLADGKLQNEGAKVKVADLVRARRGSQKKIAQKSKRSAGHLSLVFSGERKPNADIRRAASEVFRVPQRDLLFPLDEPQSVEGVA